MLSARFLHAVTIYLEAVRPADAEPVGCSWCSRDPRRGKPSFVRGLDALQVISPAGDGQKLAPANEN
jgi:hypothetical protein